MLHRADVVEQAVLRQRDVRIAKGRFHFRRCDGSRFLHQVDLGAGRGRPLRPRVEAVADAAVPRRLPLETVHHRLHGGRLVGLGFELQLHCSPTSRRVCSISRRNSSRSGR